MAAPFVFAAVAGGAVLVSVGAAAVMRPIRNRAGYSLAILGGVDVGKTTLLRELRDREPADFQGGSTGKFWIGSGLKHLKLDVGVDLPGHGGGLGMPQWKAAVLAADHVWYVFRADLVAQGDHSELERLKSQLGLLEHWRNSMKRRKPKVTLVGTWADADPGFTRDSRVFTGAIIAAPAIAVAALKLGNAPVVVGTLATSDGAARLIEDLGAA